MTDQDNHSILAPSSAVRWTTCTRSPSFIQELRDAGKIPQEDSSSDDADEGTLAHDLAAKCLQGLMDTSEIAAYAMKQKAVEIDNADAHEMQEHVKGYVELAERLKLGDDKQLIEAKVPLFYKPEDNGTVDYALLNPSRIYILDLKYGRGVEVDAKNNKQVASYALSLVDQYEMVYDWDDETLVTLAIYQPRTQGKALKLWAVSLGNLKNFGLQMIEAKADIDVGDKDVLKFDPSEEACRWCPAKARCEARQKWAAQHMSKEGIEAAAEFIDLDDPAAGVQEAIKAVDGELTDKQICAIVEGAPIFISWFNSVMKGLVEIMAGDNPIEGLKLVQGKAGNRTWGDEEGAAKLLKPKVGAANVFTKKIISPSQAEKLLKGQDLSTKFSNRFEELIVRPTGSHVVVPVTDERDDITPKRVAESDFTDLDQEDEDPLG